jgi:Family of unknown function (DUF6279)
MCAAPRVAARVSRYGAAMGEARTTKLVPWLALAAALLVGCSSVTVRLAGWYVTRRLDAYLDFTSDQKARARMRVDEALTVLRSREIPAWITLLGELRAGLHDGLDETRIAELQRKYDARLDAGVALLAPRFAIVLAELDGAQLDHFAERMREDLDEHYEERSLAPAERARRIEDRALDVLEDAVGDLDDDQEARFRALVRSLPDERPAQYRSAQEHVTRFRAFMATKPSAAAIDATLRELWEHRYDGLGPGRDKTTRRAEQRKGWLAVDRLLTQRQRARAEAHVSERMRTLARFALPVGADAPALVPAS